jgi:predicted RNA-binding protein YlxR (DUF448 family)
MYPQYNNNIKKKEKNPTEKGRGAWLKWEITCLTSARP